MALVLPVVGRAGGVSDTTTRGSIAQLLPPDTLVVHTAAGRME
jgi:hypothetical protein